MNYRHNGAGSSHRSPVRFESPEIGLILGAIVVALTVLVLVTSGGLI